MGKSEFKISILDMDDGIKHRCIDITRQQVKKSVLRMEPLPVKDDGQTGIQEHVIPQHLLNILRDKMILAENILIRDEGNDGTVS